MAPTSLPRIPVSTYRLQFNRSFTFADAQRIVPYLRALGITDCYVSSYLMAVPGSFHGYDLVDPTKLNPEIGTKEELHAFAEALRAHGMGQILDIVPNHMGIGRSANAWWLDVLENGPSSHFAHFFDIDWSPVKRELEHKVLLPILGDLYGVVLEKQEITLEHDAGSFWIRYGEHRLPVTPKSWVRILSHGLDDLIAQAGADSPPVLELQSVITALGHLPSRFDVEPARVTERHREKEIIRQRLATLVSDSPVIADFIRGNVDRFNGEKSDPRSFDLLDELLNDQVYRLAYWRVASEEINYRRFFDINELAAVRMEDDDVFKTAHGLVLELVKEGVVTGLRIDHVDGLYDPGRYLHRVQAEVRQARALRNVPQESIGKPLFVVVEKILNKGEPLPRSWPIHGTTGYDFLNLVGGLFVQQANRRAMDDLYAQFTRGRLSFEDLVYEKKKLIMRVSMASEINVLGHQLNRISERDRKSRDFTLNSLTNAIREIIACFPVYRTYVTDGPEPASDRDRAYIELAVTRAKRRNPALSGLVFDFVRDLLLKRFEARSEEDRAERVRFVMKFQQTTSPVMAKGVEDTALYIYNRLVSLNEVGGDPDQFGLSVQSFHDQMKERRAHWPSTLSATSTHDTKRSEDVRARISVLSEIPQAWKARVMRWHKLNRKHKADIDGQKVPDRNEEYLFYQTLVGAWPFESPGEAEYRTFCQRIQAYMTKALREAKVHTSWINPDQVYEDAVQRFIGTVLDRTGPNPFLEDFLPFQEVIAQHGISNSLSQLLLKAAAPGIPDCYQGAELWDLSLVDPDNRKPVDYELRARLLDELRRAGAGTHENRRELTGELFETRADGRIKLYVTMTALNYRRDHSGLFLDGDYIPLESGGAKKNHVCAFARLLGEEAVVAVVPVMVAGLSPGTGVPAFGRRAAWGDTWIIAPSWKPGSRYRNLLTGDMLESETRDDRQTLPVARVLEEFPVSLLERIA